MFGKKYKATLEYITYNNFIISRENEVKLDVYKLFSDINKEYNVKIIKYKVTKSNIIYTSNVLIDKNILSYEIIIESENKDDLEEVLTMLDKYVFDMFSIRNCKIEKV